jgi:sec-independent protein translocase protein TatB
MFNVGGGEFLVIALVALIVLGPQRLPDAARQVGKAMGELRRMSAGFQSDLKDAFNETETTTPRRDVLGAPPAEAPTPPAVRSVSGQAKAPVRRTPLRAAPVTADEARATGAPAKQAAPVSKTPRPRSKGS